MIFDWIENSIIIDQKGVLSHEDKWDKRHSYQQQESYVYYLQRQGVENSEIEKRWIAVMKKTDSDFKLLNAYDIAETFQTLLLRIIDLPKEFWERKDKNIVITADEISFINSLKRPKWFRKYVFLILGYYKFQKTYSPTVFFPSEISGWAYEEARKNENVAQHRLYKSVIWTDNKKCGSPIVVKAVSGKLSLVLQWVSKEEGTPIVSFLTPNDLLSRFDLIEQWMAQCEKCGQLFRASTKQKTNLCARCMSLKSNERSKRNRALAKSTVKGDK